MVAGLKQLKEEIEQLKSVRAVPANDNFIRVMEVFISAST
jgi:hypothetical protein